MFCWSFKDLDKNSKAIEIKQQMEEWIDYKIQLIQLFNNLEVYDSKDSSYWYECDREV